MSVYVLNKKSGGGTASASFTIIQTDSGTYPQATGPTDTLTLTSTDGSVVITGDSGTDAVNFQILNATLSASVNTTDATPTIIQFFPIQTDTVSFIEARIVGRRTGGISGTVGDTCYSLIRCKANNIAGTLNIQGLTKDQSLDNVNWNATFQADNGFSPPHLNVVIQGDTDNNITWLTYTTKETV